MLNKLQLFLLIFLIGGGVIAQDVADSKRFGIVEGFWLPDVTCELGVGWERIIFDWTQHQPESADDWHTLNVDDRWLKAADDCQREVVALLKNTPAWATDGTPGIGVPRGLDLPIDDPDNLWAVFVRRAVDYYASRGVQHFIIWNEPDITAETYGYEFEGDLDDYFQMLKVAYLTAKEANPAAIIHLAGTTYWHDVNNDRRPYVERLVERILQDPDAAANNYYFDVLSLHIYFRTDTIYDITNEMREMLDSNGLTGQTIWVNETNAAPTDDPFWQVVRPVYQIDLEMQAAFLVQAAALGLAGGIERMAVYKLYDQNLPPGGESFGILSPPDRSPRPAYDAWKMVNQTFDDVESASLARTETVDVVRLTHRNGQETIAAWARTGSPTQIRIEALGDKAYQSDQYGNVTILRPDENRYTLMLSPAQCNETDGCFLGGNVLLLMQLSGESQVQEVTPDGDVPLVFE